MKEKKFPVFTASLLSLIVFSGCVSSGSLDRARNYRKKSELLYQRSISQYKELISKNKGLGKAYFELGRLYYEHGDFNRAIEVLKKTTDPQSAKFLAISYYRLGNFVDALEIFNAKELDDEEFKYYHGLASERLNLFDQALAIYRSIKSGDFATLARERIELIEKQSSTAKIQKIDAKTAKILTDAPDAQKYPQAGALVLLCEDQIEVSPKNTEVARSHYLIKILNERGKESFSETQIDYDSTYEKVELVYARTIKPDGTVVEVGSRHIRDVSKYLNFPLYSNARVFIISFPEVTEGSSIEYRVNIYRNQLINKKDFIVNYPLQASEPIISANFSISMPKAKRLCLKNINEKYNDFGAELKPNIEDNDGCLIYRWRFKDVPQIIPESNMPPETEINPTILISTFDKWQEVYDWWWNLAKDKISSDEPIKTKVRELTRGLDSQEAKARSIYNFCAQKIRYVAVEYGQAGYEPHAAPDIFKNKYGDCKDQAILLVTMLREAGLKSWPLLIGTKGYYNLLEDFSSITFNHCIAALSLNDKIIFLDPTAETCPFGDLPGDDQDRKILLMKDDGYEIKITPLLAASRNLLKHEFVIKVRSDESIAAKKSVATRGVYEQGQRHWLLYTPPELIREELQERIQEVSIGAQLKSYNVENADDLNKPVILNYEFQGPEYFTNAQELRIMPQLSVVDRTLVSREKRRYPIDFGILDTRQTIFAIELPPDFIIQHLPADISEDNPWIKFEVVYRQEGQKIYFNQSQELKKNIITQEEYPDFKKFFENLSKNVKQRIVLKKVR